MRKRFLSALLALCMVLAILPPAAFAANGDFYIEDGNLVAYNGSGGAVTIPSGVTGIGARSFFDCENLTSITVPNSVTSIYAEAFCGCTNLTSITIPSSVTEIGASVFSGCTSLKTVYYNGTGTQWNAIEIGGDNSELEIATVHYNSTGPTQSTPSISEEPPTTNPTDPDGIQDTIQTRNYKVISLHDSSNTEIDFSYAVPTSGVAMLIFFRAESCSNSVYTLKSIAQSSWVRNSNLRIVLVETTGASKETVQSFVDESLGTNQIYFFDVLYRPHSANNPPTDSPYYLQFQYTKLLYGSNSVAWPFVMLITEHQARNYIQFSDMGMRDAAYYGNALSTLLGTVDYTDTVNVTVAGIQYYNHASDVVKSVNTYRSQNGQTNLTWNKTLTEYAMQRAAEIALYYDHIRPNGESYNSIFDSQYGSYAWVGENIAWGQTGATEVMNSWMNSEGHRANILSANYTQIGVGCFTSRNTTYWVQLFGDSRTNTAQINSGDVKQANVTVSTLVSHLSTHLTTMDTSLTISSGETATVYFANTNSQSGKDTLLVPIVSDVKDKDNSSLTIVSASVGTDGTVTLSPQATGTGTAYFKAYEGDANPATISLGVEKEISANISRSGWVSSNWGVYHESYVRTAEQAMDVYRHLESRVDAVTASRIYEIIFKSQYRPQTLGGASWPWPNSGMQATSVTDPYLGESGKTVTNIVSKGCAAYARFASLYIYNGLEGTGEKLEKLSFDEKKKVAELQAFIEEHATPGERIWLHHSGTGGAHGIVYLTHDDDGIYFIDNPGSDGSSPTQLHYCSWQTLSKNLRESNGYYLSVNKVVADKNGCRLAGTWNCPVELTITYQGETLSSKNINGTATASFGSLSASGEPSDRTITFDLDYHADYEMTVIGTDNGFVDFKLLFTYEDGETCYREYLNIPITVSTNLAVSHTNINDGITLFIDTDADGTTDSCWYAGVDETVTKPDTDILLQVNGIPSVSNIPGSPGNSNSPSGSSNPSSSNSPSGGYNVSVPSNITGGTVTASSASASAGTKVTITATPSSGYELNTLTATDSSGKVLTLVNEGSGKYSFTMPSGKVSIDATFRAVEALWSNPFTDVSTGAWYYNAVRFVNQNGLMSGVGNSLFAPDTHLSRAMLAEILYNKEGRPIVTAASSFSDVVAEAWYADAVTWAAVYNIVGGYGNGRFGPGDDITREQFAVILYRYAGSPIPPNLWLDFTDAYKVSDWAQDAMRWAVDQGILNGKGNGILDPTGKATRAEAAQMLKNYLEK